MNITITSNIAEVRKSFAEFSDRRFQSALATGLTRTAVAIGKTWTARLTELDRPTALTRRAVQVIRAENTAVQLSATIKLRDQASGAGGTAPVQWLAPLEMGGDRGAKRFEQALQSRGSMPRGWKTVPGPAAKLDGYGNVSRGQIVQVLAQLGGNFSEGYERVISANASKRRARIAKLGRVYVAIPPRNMARLAPGIYERNGRNLRAVFFFVEKTNYDTGLELRKSAKEQARERIALEIHRALQESLQRLQARNAAAGAR